MSCRTQILNELIARESMCLPTDALLLPTTSSSGGSAMNTMKMKLPNWVLLDSIAYMVVAEPNHTTAQALAQDGRTTIQVTFLIAHPPRQSYWTVCLLVPQVDHDDDLMIPIKRDQDEEEEEEEDPAFGCTPKILATADHLALIEVELTTHKHRHYLVYSATAAGGSLVVIPDIHDLGHYSKHREPYGLVPSSPGPHHNDNEFILAALTSTSYGHPPQFHLHLFGSTTCTWTRQPLSVDYGRTRKLEPDCFYPTKVIALGDGLLGWVDLWKGILVCEVRAIAAAATSSSDSSPAVARFVPMPKSLPRNQKYLNYSYASSLVRDATFSHGHIRCVELERLVRPKHRDTYDHELLHDDPSELLLLHDSEAPMVLDDDYDYGTVGWRLITWFRALHWGHWHRGTMLHSDEVGILSWKDMETCSPILCADNDNLVYLISVLEKRDRLDNTAWMVVVDTKTRSLPHQLMPFSTQRSSHENPTHIPCTLTRYMSQH